MKHVMKIQKPTKGDEEVTWDPANPGEVKHAQEQFELAVKEGKRPFTVVRDLESGQGKPGEPIKEFDPSLAEIIFAAPLAGG